MTKTRKMRIGIVAVLVAASLVAVALPVSGSHADDVKTKDAKGVGPYAYIGLGIGDHIISCPGDTLFTVGSVESVSVHAEEDVQGNVLVDGDEQFGSLSPVGGHIKLPGSGFGGHEQGNPVYPLCLGGAFDSVTTDTQPGLPNSWEVWGEDFVYKVVKQATMSQVDIVPAMFARLVIQASGGAGVAASPDTCAVGPTPPGTIGGANPNPNLDVCIHDNQNKVMTKVMAQFSACGKGRVAGLNDAVPAGDPNWWQEAEDEFALQGIPIDSYTVTKTVFMDGPLFAFLDCGIGGAGVAAVYDNVAEWWNNPPSGANPLAPAPQHNACNDTNAADSPVPPGLPGLGVCLFDFPAGASFCWSDAAGPEWADEHIAAFGLIGDIGWSVDDNQAGCTEPTGDGPWGKVLAGTALVIHNGLPASPVTVSVTTTP